MENKTISEPMSANDSVSGGLGSGENGKTSFLSPDLQSPNGSTGERIQTRLDPETDLE